MTTPAVAPPGGETPGDSHSADTWLRFVTSSCDMSRGAGETIIPFESNGSRLIGPPSYMTGVTRVTSVGGEPPLDVPAPASRIAAPVFFVQRRVGVCCQIVPVVAALLERGVVPTDGEERGGEPGTGTMTTSSSFSRVRFVSCIWTEHVEDASRPPSETAAASSPVRRWVIL
jgi:hypothetical protein